MLSQAEFEKRKQEEYSLNNEDYQNFVLACKQRRAELAQQRKVKSR